MNKTLLATILLLLTPCLAQDWSGQVDKVTHDVVITIMEDDTALVEEDFLIRINNETVKETLKTTLQKEAFNISELRPFGITPTIQLKSTQEEAINELTRSSTGRVMIRYRVELPEIQEEKGRKEIMAIRGEKFSFYKNGNFQLPYEPSTKLKIRIPTKYPIYETEPEPYQNNTYKEGGIVYQEIVWSDMRPITTKDFHVYYEKEMSITSTLSFETLQKELTEYFENPVYLIVFLIVIVILIWYRNAIGFMIKEAFAGEPEQ